MGRGQEYTRYEGSRGEKIELSKMRMAVDLTRTGWWHLYQEYSPSFGKGRRNTDYGAMLHRRGHRSMIVLLLPSQLLLLFLFFLIIQLLLR